MLELAAPPEWAAPLALMTVLSCYALVRPGRQTAEAAACVARLLFVAVACLGALALAAGPARLELLKAGGAHLALLVDPLSVIMALLVAFLGMVVTRYSVNYLAGDPRQAAFSRWLLLTLVCVLGLALSSNLLMFTLAWVATSLCLHQLLVFYKDRPAARVAARKKFLISRLADACMLTAVALVWKDHGTWEFHELFSRPPGPSGGLVAGLLVAAALMKSAQFPFHSWLPDTLETPTPVSALMHAGIINGGGYLIVRLSPLITHNQAAMSTLAVLGAVTALFASVIMMTQTSVKKALAWSTVSQMGFMMLQCGLGAFALAVMHIVAHSLYKAHAFLSSGSVVRVTQAAWTPVGRPAAHPGVVLGSLLAAVGAGALVLAVFGREWLAGPGQMLLAAIFVMAMAHLLWTLWSSSLRKRLLLRGLLLVTGATVLSFSLHAGFEHLLAGSVQAWRPQWNALETGVMLVVGALFLAVLIFQSQLPSWAGHPAVARLYVHASNGFYLGTLFSRLARKITL